MNRLQEIKLKYRVKEILKEERRLKEERFLKEGLLLEFMGMEGSYFGPTWIKPEHNKQFIGAFAAPFKELFGGVKKMGTEVRSSLKVIAGTIYGSILPFVGKDFKGIFDERHKQISEVNGSLKGIREETRKALLNTDTAVCAFFMYPTIFLTEKLFEKSPEMARELAEVIGGPSIKDIGDKIDSWLEKSTKKVSSFADDVDQYAKKNKQNIDYDDDDQNFHANILRLVNSAAKKGLIDSGHLASKIAAAGATALVSSIIRDNSILIFEGFETNLNEDDNNIDNKNKKRLVNAVAKALREVLFNETIRDFDNLKQITFQGMKKNQEFLQDQSKHTQIFNETIKKSFETASTRFKESQTFEGLNKITDGKLEQNLKSKASSSEDIKKIFEQSKDELIKGASNEVRQFFILAQQNIINKDSQYISDECPCLQAEIDVLKKIQQLI